MYKKYLILILLIGVIAFQCSQDPMSPDSEFKPVNLKPVEKNLIEADNQFGLKLFKKINEAECDKNIFISPLSVSMALGMTLNGANGKTYQNMQTTLELNGFSNEEINESYQSIIALLTGLDPKVKFQIANSIWYRQEMNFEPDFINLNKTYFNAEVAGLDFDSPNAPNIINQWVGSNTNGKIKEIITSINPEDVMFLINAIYFKGIWTYEFQKDRTHDDSFHRSSELRVPVQLMMQKSLFNYFENDELQAIDLPYGGGNFTMTVILPRYEVDIDALITKLDNDFWSNLISRFAKDSVNLELPKFKLEYELKLNDVLIALGMGVAFSDQADFTNMYKPGNLYISEVKHKSFVEVNEEGTEAAAVTSVGIALTSIGPKPELYMIVNRPFIFAIRENASQTILFIGKIVDPGLN